jgi:hypothetical protein
MPTILVRLEPSRLRDPDSDLRYEIPDLLKERSLGAIIDAGYDYEADTQAMQIFLRTSDVDAALVQVIALLEHEPLHGNELASAAQVGVSPDEPGASRDFRIVYPTNLAGTIRARQ